MRTILHIQRRGAPHKVTTAAPRDSRRIRRPRRHGLRTCCAYLPSISFI
jgi:hypothetical protein